MKRPGDRWRQHLRAIDALAKDVRDFYHGGGNTLGLNLTLEELGSTRSWLAERLDECERATAELFGKPDGGGESNATPL